MSESATYSMLSFYYWDLLRWFYVPVPERGQPGSALRVTTGQWIMRAVIVGFFLGFSGAIRQQNILHSLAVPFLLMTQSRRLWPSPKPPAMPGGLRPFATF